jgi:hypothetical protein
MNGGSSLVPEEEIKETGVSSVGFEVLTALTVKSTIFWVVMPCSSVQVEWCFGGIYCLLLAAS